MNGPFDDLFAGIGPNRPSAPRPSSPTSAEKGVQIRGREFDGAFYVRAEDVVALLELNGVLPKVTAQLKKAVSR